MRSKSAPHATSSVNSSGDASGISSPERRYRTRGAAAAERKAGDEESAMEDGTTMATALGTTKGTEMTSEMTSEESDVEPMDMEEAE